MHAVVRNYSGARARELPGLLKQHKAEVDALFHSIKGFVSYAAAETESGSFTMTVCETKAGADESVVKARDWVMKNVAGLGAPTVTEGAVSMHIR